MKRMMVGLALLAGAALMAPSVAAAQVRTVGVLQCDEGEAQGELGISGLDCRGDCTLTMNEKGEEQAWSFTVEPRINGISPGGPADGLLRVGDFLVAIDGIPITTRDGGIRYANVEPGQEVDILVRREGKLERVMIQAASICPPPPPRRLSPAPLLPPREALVAETVSPPPPRAVTVGRLAPPPPPDTLLPTRLRTLGVAVSPRVRVAPVRRDTLVSEAVDALSALPRRATTGLLGRVSPTGRLGIGFTCTECGTRTDEERGANVWFFSGPLEVTTVNVGGPADRAGIQRGDLIRAIGGHAIETDEGGLAFTRLTAGERVRMTVVKRNGSEVEVGLVPEARVRVGVGALAPVPSPAPVEEVAAPPLPPALPARAAVPAPTAAVSPPKGMPLRYSGVIGGVEVEVRGNPVTVSEMRGVRTIYINAEGLWIRISIPRERE